MPARAWAKIARKYAVDSHCVEEVLDVSPNGWDYQGKGVA